MNYHIDVRLEMKDVLKWFSIPVMAFLEQNHATGVKDLQICKQHAGELALNYLKLKNNIEEK